MFALRSHAERGVEPPGGVQVGGRQGGGLDWHSIDPGFIESEVRACRERIGGPIDYVMLHNPEYFLSAQMQRRVPIADAWDEMYERLERTFRTLEQLCDEGIISKEGGYGVSGNFLSCMFSTSGSGNVYEALCLDRVVDAAAAAAGGAAAEGQIAHRFRMAQFPLNALENGAVLGRANVVPEAAEGDCEVAAKLGVAVLVNRPLNALPLPGVSSGDWGRNGAEHLKLREAKPMGAVEALFQRVLSEALAAESSESTSGGGVPFQQLALQIAMSGPSVSCCLNGMRAEGYVNDAAAVLQKAPLSVAAVERAMKSARMAAEELGCDHRRNRLW